MPLPAANRAAAAAATPCSGSGYRFVRDASSNTPKAAWCELPGFAALGKIFTLHLGKGLKGSRRHLLNLSRHDANREIFDRRRPLHTPPPSLFKGLRGALGDAAIIPTTGEYSSYCLNRATSSAQSCVTSPCTRLHIGRLLVPSRRTPHISMTQSNAR